MRCLALTQAWRDLGGRGVGIVTRDAPQSLRERCRLEQVECLEVSASAGSDEDADALARLVADRGALVVLDGYHFSKRFQALVRSAARALLVVDDFAQIGEYDADWILDQNLGTTAATYEDRPGRCRLLMGPRFALLRREFRVLRGFERTHPEVARRVLITCGGSDPSHLALRALKALAAIQAEPLEVRVVVGGDYPALEELRRAAVELGSEADVVVDAEDMSPLMSWADVSIAAAGSTAWELARTGTPTILIPIAANQARVGSELARRGACLTIEPAAAESPRLSEVIRDLAHDRSRRERMSRVAMSVVDGRGASRVADELFSAVSDLRLRRVQRGDMKLVWEWRNDPVTCQASFTSGPVPWKTHVAWFEGKLADDHTFFYLAEREPGVAVGQIRFDRSSSDEAEVHMVVAPSSRGRRLSASLIEAGLRSFYASSGVSIVQALIKPENAASIKAFRRAGFVRSAPTTGGERRVERYVWRLSARANREGDVGD